MLNCTTYMCCARQPHVVMNYLWRIAQRLPAGQVCNNAAAAAALNGPFFAVAAAAAIPLLLARCKEIFGRNVINLVTRKKSTRGFLNTLSKQSCFWVENAISMRGGRSANFLCLPLPYTSLPSLLPPFPNLFHNVYHQTAAEASHIVWLAGWLVPFAVAKRPLSHPPTHLPSQSDVGPIYGRRRRRRETFPHHPPLSLLYPPSFLL
jgi:hypothetical protein